MSRKASKKVSRGHSFIHSDVHNQIQWHSTRPTKTSILMDPVMAKPDFALTSRADAPLNNNLCQLKSQKNFISRGDPILGEKRHKMQIAYPVAARNFSPFPPNFGKGSPHFPQSEFQSDNHASHATSHPNLSCSIQTLWTSSYGYPCTTS